LTLVDGDIKNQNWNVNDRDVGSGESSKGFEEKISKPERVFASTNDPVDSEMTVKSLILTAIRRCQEMRNFVL
jgi:hypothetical protein